MLPRVASRQLRSLATVARRQIHVTAASHRVYDNVLQTIGDTPVVKLNRVPTRDDVTVYAKLE